MKKIYIEPKTLKIAIKPVGMIAHSLGKYEDTVTEEEDVLSRENNAWTTPRSLWDE